jgi:hypothetical protein
MSTGRESPVRQPPTRRETLPFLTSGSADACRLRTRLVSCRRPEAHGVHAAESTRIAASRLEWAPRVARARRDGRSGSPASERPRDAGPRCERWRALERDRDAAFDRPFLYDDASLSPDRGRRPSIVCADRLVRLGRRIRIRICLSQVLTPPGGKTRRRISSIGGVPVVVSRDARLRS